MASSKQRRIITRVVILVVFIGVWMQIPDYLDSLVYVVSKLEVNPNGVISLLLAFIIIGLTADLFHQVTTAESKTSSLASAKAQLNKGIDIATLIPITEIPSALLNNQLAKQTPKSIDTGLDKMHPILPVHHDKIKSVLVDRAEPSQFFAPVPTQEKATEEEGIIEENIDKIFEEDYQNETASLTSEILGISYDDPEADPKDVHEEVEVIPKTKESIKQLGLDDLNALDY